MALSKMQYDFIQRGYEETQIKNHYLLLKRREEINNKIPEYKALEDLSGSISCSCTKLLLDGDDQALSTAKRELKQIKIKKDQLLIEAGYPSTYLESIYTCLDCHDTGFIDGDKCHCYRNQEISLLYEQSNIQQMMEKENFSTLSYEYYEGEDLARFQNAERKCKDFIMNFNSSFQNLFFYGTVGTGKSFLSSCIAKELLSTGSSVIYFSANGLFETLARYSFDTKLKETLYNFNKDLYNCELVIIDDLGTEVTNSFVTSQLFGLLNERQLRQKSTIISTNLSLEELRDRYSDRIFSRITSNYTICILSGKDIRIQKRVSLRK